jgi:hypothetical protein
MCAVGAMSVPFGTPPRGEGSSGEFIAGVEDLPLMPGMREIPTAGLAFDSTGGRIVEAYASGPVRRDAVLAFYAETLPQLGWTADADTRFRRRGEVLVLEFLRSDPLTVRFTLVPE